MCIYAITIMHKMYIHFAKNQTKKQGIYFRHFTSLYPTNGMIHTFACSFSSKKNWNPHLFSHEKEKPRKETLFLKYVCHSKFLRKKRESLTSILLKREPRRWTFRWRLRAKSSLNWFRQNYFPKFEHFDWLNSEISFDN